MNPTLRKAAILISVLDTRSADALLESMPADYAAKVRRAVMELEDVSTAEQEQVIQAFLKRDGEGSPTTTDADVELELSAASESAVNSQIAAASSVSVNAAHAESSTSQPFVFLNEASGETIAKVLVKEQAQLTAAVLAHLAPERAAEVLSHLPASLAGEVLVRIANLDEMSTEVLQDIEQQLRTTLSPHLRSKQEADQGFARLQAILKSSSLQHREQMLSAVARKDERLAIDLTKQLLQPRTAVLPPQVPSAATITASRATGMTQAMPQKTDKNSSRQAAAGRMLAAATVSARTPVPTQPQRHDIQFTDLLSLDDHAWQQLLQAADQNVVLLAFAGAEPKLIERVLRGFPKREAEAWRREFSHPGPVRLRDIDAAQQVLVQLACELFSLVPPTTQPSYAAVA